MIRFTIAVALLLLASCCHAETIAEYIERSKVEHAVIVKSLQAKAARLKDDLEMVEDAAIHPTAYAESSIPPVFPSAQRKRAVLGNLSAERRRIEGELKAAEKATSYFARLPWRLSDGAMGRIEYPVTCIGTTEEGVLLRWVVSYDIQRIEYTALLNEKIGWRKGQVRTLGGVYRVTDSSIIDRNKTFHIEKVPADELQNVQRQE